MRTITFVPRAVAQQMNGDGKILVSIVHSDQELPKHNEGWNDVSYQVFDDITGASGGLVMFDVGQASDIIKFIDSHDCDVVVHCEAGMSRSAAVAKWISDNREEIKLVHHKDGIGTVAHYNDYVYKTMDASQGNDMASYYQQLEENAMKNDW